jgi:hypothetical protein
MSLDKAIASGKEWRKSFKVSPVVYSKRNRKYNDPSCRNHGTCPDCERLRKYKNRKAELNAKDSYVYARDEYTPHNM